MAKSTRAEELRRHREIFLYAREHDLTLKAAEKALAHERAIAAQARLDAMRRCGRTLTAAPAVAADRPLRPAPAHAPWMMRD